jgi:putative MATE family efflux protein
MEHAPLNPPTLSSPSRAMFVLALPVLAEESLNLLVGYTDWFLAGRFLPGAEPMAAMGLVAYWLWILPSFFSFVGIGGLAVVARLVGAGRGREAAHVARQSLFLGFCVALFCMAVVAAFGDDFVRAMQYSGQTAELATRYIYFLIPAIPLVMIEQVGTACLRGAGDTVSGLVARVVVNLVNIVLSTCLVTGLGPFPDLGWDGLAIGTATGHAIGGLIILYRLFRGSGGLRLLEASSDGMPRLRLDVPTIRRILRIGLPGGIDVLAVIGCHLIYAGIINSMGTLAQAAHGLGVQIEAMSYLPGSAFAVAAATIAGQSLGADDQRRAVRGVKLCAVAALTIMTVAALVLFFGGELVAQFFTGRRTELTVLTGQLLKIVALSCPSLAILMVLIGALRGSGDTAWPLAITFIGLVGVRIPGAVFLAWDEVPIPFTDASLPALGLGVAGAWWAMVGDVVLRSLLAAGRFAQGGWKRVEV